MQHANATVSLVENLYSFLARSKVRFFYFDTEIALQSGLKASLLVWPSCYVFFVKAFAHYKEFIAFIVFRS